jgi:hypothetical protein
LDKFGTSLWNELVHSKTTETIEKIVKYTNRLLEECITYYISYYRNEDVAIKFKNRSNVEKLITEIQKVKNKIHVKPQGSDIDDAWGCIYTNDLYTIHLNYYNFFNGKINASIYDTIVHEMGHIIDFQLRSMGERPSYMEGSVLRPINETDQYIVSREEDYARVQRLRNLLWLSPLADETELKNGIQELVSKGKFVFPNLNVEFSSDNKLMILKASGNIRNLDLSHLSWVLGNLIVNDYLASDLGYLFAKYGQVVGGVIHVDLSKIVTINKFFVDKGGGDFGSFA